MGRLGGEQTKDGLGAAKESALLNRGVGVDVFVKATRSCEK